MLKISKNLEVLILRPLILERKIAEKGLPSLIQRFLVLFLFLFCCFFCWSNLSSPWLFSLSLFLFKPFLTFFFNLNVRCQTIKRLELSAELSQDQLSKVLVNISQNCKQLEVLHIGAQVLVGLFIFYLIFSFCLSFLIQIFNSKDDFTEQMVDLLVHCKYLKEISVSQENDTGILFSFLFFSFFSFKYEQSKNQI